MAKALSAFYPELAAKLNKLVLYNDRDPRPGEADGVDYHFRTRSVIEGFKNQPGFIVMDVRGDLQALDLKDVQKAIATGDAFFEGNPFVGRALLQAPEMAQVKKLGVFVSPLCKEEIIYLKAPERNLALRDFVTDVMRRKLLRRTQKQKGILSLKELENIEKRAGSAYNELKFAHQFDCVIPNHDGEDSENWNAFYYPLGDARKTLQAFAGLLKGENPLVCEKWEEGLLP
jgi:guanylate kinase